MYIVEVLNLNRQSQKFDVVHDITIADTCIKLRLSEDMTHMKIFPLTSVLNIDVKLIK